MRSRWLLVLSLSSLVAAPALASFSGGSKNDEPPPSRLPEASAAQSTSRQEAEKWYGDAYDEIAKAKKDSADGKAKSAEKHFKKAAERGQRAVELDSTYHEAWNLVGFAARNLKNYDQSLAAYTKCLSIKPDFAPAREYLGEAYVELGQLDKAREQLAFLERMEAVENAAGLKTKIDAWVTAHPEAKTQAVAASADSTAARPVSASTDTSSTSGK